MAKSGNYVNLSRFKEALRQGIAHQLKKQGVAEGSMTGYTIQLPSGEYVKSTRGTPIWWPTTDEAAQALQQVYYGDGARVVKVNLKRDPYAYNGHMISGDVAEGDQLDEMNPMLVRDGLQVVIDFLSQYPTATTLTAGVAGAAAGTAIIAKLVKNAWKNHKELEQLKQDVINWSSQKLHANKNVAAKGGKVAKIIQAEIARRKKDVAEGKYDLEEATSMKQQWKNDVKQVHGNNVRFEVEKAVRSNEETQSSAYDENGNKVAYFYHKSGRQHILPKPKVKEDLSKTDIKKQISKFEELALAANRAGDDEKSKQYQQKIQSLKQKMSQGVAEGLAPGQAAWKKEMMAKGAVSFKRDQHGGGAVDRIVAYDKDGKVVGGFNRKGVAEGLDPETTRLEQDVRNALENGDDYTAKQYAKMAPTPEAKKYLLNIIKQEMYGTDPEQGVAEGLPNSLSASDYMPGPVMHGDSENVPYNNKRLWDSTVDRINAKIFDDNSEYIGDSKGKRIEHNGVIWALWNNDKNIGWVNIKGRQVKPWPIINRTLGEQGVAEGKSTYGDGKEMYVGIEAYGVRGMKSTPWRKKFKNQAAFEKWLDSTEGDVEVYGTREINLNDFPVKNPR
jgi:hypothetical protein